jgi:hypothetical protein
LLNGWRRGLKRRNPRALPMHRGSLRRPVKVYERLAALKTDSSPRTGEPQGCTSRGPKPPLPGSPWASVGARARSHASAPQRLRPARGWGGHNSHEAGQLHTHVGACSPKRPTDRPTARTQGKAPNQLSGWLGEAFPSHSLHSLRPAKGSPVFRGENKKKR